MQTFLPYPDFRASADALDPWRRRNQRNEAKVLLRVNLHKRLYPGVPIGWQHHPAGIMWLGYEKALATYGLAVCQSCVDAGWVDSVAPFFEAALYVLPGSVVMPPWLGDEAFHRSHRSNLLRKLPIHYAGIFTDVPDDLPYIWPGRP